MNRAVIVIHGALVSTAAAAALAGQAQAPLIVAYMTSDGELVPIARYDGRVWRNTWPEPIPNGAPLPVRTVSEIPRGWLGQPVPLTWTAWSQATGKQQRVTVTGVDCDGACVEAITLATSLKPDPRSGGLAFNRPTTVDAIVALEQSSREWDLLRREVASHFRTAITKTVLPQPGSEQREMGPKFAHSRALTSLPMTLWSSRPCSGMHDSRSFSSKRSANLAGFRPIPTTTHFRTAAGSGGTVAAH